MKASDMILSVMLTSASLMFVNMLGALATLTVEWREPVRSLIENVSALLVQMNILNFQCILGSSIVASYAFT